MTFLTKHMTEVIEPNRKIPAVTEKALPETIKDITVEIYTIKSLDH